jgi:hypothetical protein
VHAQQLQFEERDQEAMKGAEVAASDYAQEIKSDLARRLLTMSVRYEKAQEALKKLELSVEHRASLPYQEDAFRQVFERWIDEQIRSFEAQGKGIAHASIDRTEIDKRVGGPDKYDQMCPVAALRGNSISLMDAIDSFLKSYDFELLVSELERLSVGLEQKGLREAADRIANDLGLNRDYGREHLPKRTARYLVFSRWLYADSFGGYGYRTTEDLHNLAKAFGAAEEDAGLAGLEQSMDEIVRVIGDAREKLPSRTKIGEDNAVEAVVYKEKLELRVNHDVGDGILAFVVSHTSKSLIDFS